MTGEAEAWRMVSMVTLLTLGTLLILPLSAWVDAARAVHSARTVDLTCEALESPDGMAYLGYGRYLTLR